LQASGTSTEAGVSPISSAPVIAVVTTASPRTPSALPAATSALPAAPNASPGAPVASPAAPVANAPTGRPVVPPREAELGPISGEKSRGVWSRVYEWPLMPIHAALLPDGRVMTYGTKSSRTGYGKFMYDVFDPTRDPSLAASHLTLENTTGTLFSAAPS
jgi:hypothetical protein